MNSEAKRSLDAAIAEIVREGEADRGDERLVVGDTELPAPDVLHEELAAAVVADVGVVDHHLDRRLEAWQILGRKRKHLSRQQSTTALRPDNAQFEFRNQCLLFDVRPRAVKIATSSELS